ncbi:enoyl-CoA delta isomerase 2, mitochondrial-like [Limulus polyphemus]|uniref:Enoyl-CoA delta isomerase 2, mitochondrial-like n=1 Tax=Limulus polyphemus TaxID=6850 RepID=A0ABM1BYP6_LIMPO|nr:enoyl-CoA delta isomerase 2, mitochondrial-like [Limulus polyphemus]
MALRRGVSQVYLNLKADRCTRKWPLTQFTKQHQNLFAQSSFFGCLGVRMCSNLNSRFDSAKEKLNTLKEDPGNKVKLRLYSLFKQATVGLCSGKKPPVFDFVAKAKWEAWNSLGSMSQEDAMKEYIKTVEELAGKEKVTSDNSQSSSNSSQYNGLQVSTQNGITTVKLNRPEKKNALTTQMYRDISEILSNTAKDKSSVITLFTGAGDYYCSGNDLGNFNLPPGVDIAQMAKDASVLLRDFVDSFITFPKPLVAAVNGPATGISVTLLGLFDVVYASEKATFHTPFSLLGQSPEGCSSYIFPKIMGPSKASEMLLFNRKITAAEAKSCGLVSEVFPDTTFEVDVSNQFKGLEEMSINSIIYAKKLVRDLDRDLLHKVNKEECERLVERWQSEDCMKAIMAFFQKRSKN